MDPAQAELLQIRILRSLTGEQRVRIGAELYRIGDEHPEGFHPEFESRDLPG